MNDLKCQLIDIIGQCVAFHHTKEESAFLNQFVNVLQQTSDDEDNFEINSLNVSLNRRKFLHEVVHANPGPNFHFELLNDCAFESGMLWTLDEPLDWFLFYIFNRRFGWPDLEENSGHLMVSCLHSINKWRPSVRNEELHFKPKIVASLDLLILWIFHQPVNLMSLKMFHSAIQMAHSSPFTRLQLSIHAMDILKERFEETDEEHFQAVQRLIVVILTDMWSQIRSAGAVRLGPIVEKFTLNHLECIFVCLTQLCRANDQYWQVMDGAINAVNVTIKRFHLITHDLNDSQNHRRRGHCSRQEIRIGRHILTHMPNFILNEMQSLVYILASNAQLTIRETAIKAFIACIIRCDEIESENAFIDVYNRLKRHASIELNSAEGSLPSELDAYTAESFIHLITILYKRIRNYQSHAQNWDILHNTFDLYLMHSASSVRLATSNLYKCVVSKNINTPLIVKNILWCVLRDWKPNQSLLFSRIEGEVTNISINSSGDHSQKDAKAWQWREGCLLVYELVSKLLIKNHCMHAFGSSNHIEEEPRPITAVSLTFSNSSATLMLHDEQSDWSILSGKATNENARYNTRSASVSCSNANEGDQQSETTTASDKAMPKLENHSIITRGSSNEHLDLNRLSSSHPSLNRIDCLTEEDEVHSNNEDSNNNTDYKRYHNCLHDPTSMNHNCSSFLIHVKEVERLESNTLSRGRSSNEDSLPCFHSLLSRMFYTCVESMLHPQWEVRRIANQTFPCLGELIRWADPDLLGDLICTHLVCEPRLMTVSCLLLLRDTLNHAYKLRSPAFSYLSPQNKEVRCSIDKFLHVVDSHIHIWLQSCLHYLRRRDSLDWVTVLSSHIALLSVLHYLNYPTTQALPILKTLLSVFQQIDALITFPQAQQQVTIYTGMDIYTCKREMSDSGTALQFGIDLLTQLKEDLLLCIQQSSPSNCDSLLSISIVILKWIHPIMKSDPRRGYEKVKIILKILSSVVGSITPSRLNSDNLPLLGYQMLHESANLLLHKTLVDVHQLRSLLDSLYSLVSALQIIPSEFFQRVLILVPLSGNESLSLSAGRRKSCLPSLSANSSDTSLLTLGDRMKMLKCSPIKSSSSYSPVKQSNRRKSLDFLTEEENVENVSKNSSSISEYHEDTKLQLFSSETHSHYYKENESSSTNSDEEEGIRPVSDRTGGTASSCNAPVDTPCDEAMGETNPSPDLEHKINEDANSFNSDFSSSESNIEDVESDWDSSSSDADDTNSADPASISNEVMLTQILSSFIKRIIVLCEDSLDGGRLSRGEIAQLRSILHSDF